MDVNQYNENRYNRKLQWYRFTFGLQQMINNPQINVLWVIYALGVVLFVKGEHWLESYVDAPDYIAPVFTCCTKIILVIFPVICAIGLCQLIGYLFAIKEEASLKLVFGNRRDIKNQLPILIYKKTDRKTGTATREFYTTISKQTWIDNTETICDLLDIHLIGEITYGGKNQDNGNFIMFSSAKGRKPMDRGAIIDEQF